MRTVKRCKIYDLTGSLTVNLKRKLTYVYNHEDDENFNEVYHYDDLYGMINDWAKENNMTPDYERELVTGGFVNKNIVETDSGRLGNLKIDGEPGEWEVVVTYPKEGESIFGMEEVALK